MFEFNFTTDDINVATAIINAIGGKANVQVIQTTQVTQQDLDAPQVTETVADDDKLSVNAINTILSRLARMDSDELKEKFGDGNDKPYRIIKNIELEEIADRLSISDVGNDFDVTYDEAIKAIQFIVKDKSVGGMTHDQMREIFEVSNSAALFREYNISEIVRRLIAKNLI